MALDAVIHLVAVGFRIMKSYKFGSTGLDYRYRLLCPGALEIYLPCHLFLAHTAFTEYDAVGFCLGYTSDILFNLFELRALSWNQRIVKLNHNALRLGIFANRFNKLLVDSRSLYHIHGSAVAHHREKIYGINVIYYGNNGKIVSPRIFAS